MFHFMSGMNVQQASQCGRQLATKEFEKQPSPSIHGDKDYVYLDLDQTEEARKELITLPVPIPSTPLRRLTVTYVAYIV